MSANEHPKISVIVPTLNVEALLDNVLSSIARKSCGFFKISAAALAKVERRQILGGQAAGKNTGWR